MPHERLVAQAVGPGVLAERLLAPALVLLERALEPAHLRVALEHEQVGRDAVEEPAVMADDHRAAREALERVLERAQRVDVEVVRGLVEQQQVGAAAQQLGEVEAVALAAGEILDALLLVAAAEVEARDVRRATRPRACRASCGRRRR